MELEEKIKGFEFIKDACCVKAGEKLGCVAVLSGIGKEYILRNGSLSLIEKMKSELENTSEVVPQEWRFLGKIPKNRFGKIDRQMVENTFLINLSFPIVLSLKATDGTTELELFFDKNSNFFKGHFEGYPILPGVVQLYFASLFAKIHLDVDLPFKQIKKIKFVKIVRPEIVIRLIITNNEETIGFKYRDDETLYSSGNFIKDKIITKELAHGAI